jgi:hypothetical protein
VGNPKYPGVLVRAKCAYDVQIDGKWSSWWDFQLKSTYPASTDYVFNYEYGVPETQVNKFGAPSMITAAKSGDVYFNGTELWGTCSQHTLPTKRLHIRVSCAVPVSTGPDDPCFKGPDGNLIADAPASGSQTGPQNSGATSRQAEATPVIQAPTVGYYHCSADFGIYPRSAVYVSNVFSGPSPYSGDFVNEKLTEWRAYLHATYTRDYESWHGSPLGGCSGGLSSKADAEARRQRELDDKTREFKRYPVQWP